VGLYIVASVAMFALCWGRSGCLLPSVALWGGLTPVACICPGRALRLGWEIYRRGSSCLGCNLHDCGILCELATCIAGRTNSCLNWVPRPMRLRLKNSSAPPGTQEGVSGETTRSTGTVGL
jgi:hypothetical protein